MQALELHSGCTRSFNRSESLQSCSEWLLQMRSVGHVLLRMSAVASLTKLNANVIALIEQHTSRASVSGGDESLNTASAEGGQPPQQHPAAFGAEGVRKFTVLTAERGAAVAGVLHAFGAAGGPNLASRQAAAQDTALPGTTGEVQSSSAPAGFPAPRLTLVCATTLAAALRQLDAWLDSNECDEPGSK